METRYFKTLQTVLETGSFNKAARILHITQSAVSQRIKFMEEYYGSPLIDRSGQLVRLTEAGSIVNEKASQILTIEGILEKELKGLSNKKSLSLCSTPTFGAVFLPQVLNRFFLKHSGDVDFKFTLNTPELTMQGFIDDEFDLAVMEHCGPLDVPTAQQHGLPPDELVFISAPSLSLPHPLITLDELLKQRLIARRDGCSSRCLLQGNLQNFGRSIDDFRVMIVYDDLHLTIETVKSGKGVAFVSRGLVQTLLANGELTQHVVKGFNNVRSRSVLISQKRINDPLIGQFLACIYDVFPGAPNSLSVSFTYHAAD